MFERDHSNGQERVKNFVPDATTQPLRATQHRLRTTHPNSHFERDETPDRTFSTSIHLLRRHYMTAGMIRSDLIQDLSHFDSS